jgi:hypothetical protein
MKINPAYNSHYVFTSLLHHGKEVSCGACPVIWEDGSDSGRPALTWADGNYHLYCDDLLAEREVETIEECILTALNGADTTFGTVQLPEICAEIRWCLLEAVQVGVIMNYPDLLQAA